ncbi:MAG: 4Fe-4S dicluster domain-containing protein [Chloroflexota bacterium]|nr:4Fe-4S dicluster domain-containing protein [Chloroflexota bacterium]
MQILDNAGTTECDLAFAAQAPRDANINRCYQCLTCSLGCPVTAYMDYLPHQVVRMVQLGLKDRVLKSSTIWLCASCETCITRCPNEVDIPGIMDSLKQMAISEGIESKELEVTNLHTVFMDNIKSHGRQYELSLMMSLKLKNKDYFSDIYPLGLKMMLKRKMNLLPPGGKAKGEMKAILERLEES